MRTPDEAKAGVSGSGSVEPGVRDQLVGEPVEALVAALRAASPRAETDWQSEWNPYDQ